MNKASIGLDNGLSPGGAKPSMMTDDFHSIGQFGKKIQRHMQQIVIIYI